MKTILLLLCITLYGCDKDNCESCTRTWTYKSYTRYQNGNTSAATQYNGGRENFTACGDDMIEAEEKTQTTYSEVPNPNYTNAFTVTEGTGTCNCQ